MTVTLVVAMAANRVIGSEGAMPWDLPEDLKHFKALTVGHPMVMGRATYESIGRPLPGRTTIVVTRDAAWSADGIETASSIDAALARGHELDDDVFVVGGGQIYAEVLDRGLVDTMVVSRVHGSPDGDTFFPRIDWQAWSEVGRVPHVGFDIVTYQRV